MDELASFSPAPDDAPPSEADTYEVDPADEPVAEDTLPDEDEPEPEDE